MNRWIGKDAVLSRITRFRTVDDRPMLCVDFDGTITDYRGGFIGFNEVGDDTNPVEGAFDFLRGAVQLYSVIIWSVRCNDLRGAHGICKWLGQKGLERSVIDKFIFAGGKPNATLFIDDRSIQFKGDWGEIIPQIQSFNPWYRTD